MSLHADALALLEGWRPDGSAQEQHRRRFVAHLRAHPDGLLRSCRPDHLTASTLVLSPDGASVLLTLHAKAHRWFQLGGHCEDGDDDLVGAARREAEEESGLTGLVLDPSPVQLSEHRVPFCRIPRPAPSAGAVLPAADDRGDPPVHHLDVRFLAVAPLTGPAVSDESLDVAWWPADALPDPDPDLVELVALARRRLASRDGAVGAAASQPAPSAASGPAVPSRWSGPSVSASLLGGSTEAAADQPSR